MAIAKYPKIGYLIYPTDNDMITPEETGTIIARLAIYNEDFLRSILQQAEGAGDALLPDDVAKLESWAIFIRALRGGIAVGNKGYSKK